jgi:hypothetical protein
MPVLSRQPINLTADVTLTWPASFNGNNLVLWDKVVVNSDQDGWAITLPAGNLGGQVSATQYFYNTGGFNFIIKDNTGAALHTINAGTIYEVALDNATTRAGTWSINPYQSGAAVINTFTIESTNASINVANGTINPPGGIVNLTLPTSLSNLLPLNKAGYPAILSTAPLTWAVRTMTGGVNITVTDGDGVANNTLIDLDSDITDLTSLEVGNLRLAANTLEVTDENGNLVLSSNGTGDIQANGVIIDADSNIAAHDLNLSGTFVSPYVPKAIVAFSDTASGDVHTISLIFGGVSTNLIPTFLSQATYAFAFATVRGDTDYTATCECASTSGDQPLLLHARFINSSKTTSGFNIVVMDAAGELFTDIPNGMTVTVWAAT